MPVSIGPGWKVGGGWSMGSGGAAPPPPPAVTDPYFMYNSLLLTGDGTNNSQNNTFLDSSTNNFAVTRAGNTTQGTFSPYGADWSNYFNGSDAYWKQASSANYILGTNDFTLECWFNPGDTTANMRRLFGVGYGGNGGSHGNSWELLFWGTESPTGQIGLNRYDGSTGTSWNTTGVTITAGQWYHIAVSRTGGVLKVFVNGTAYYSAANTFNFTQVTYGGNTELWCGLGYYGPAGGLSGPRYLNGYLSNIRIINGTGIYSSNFTPPTAPLTAVANTQLLAAQSNRFVDNSANAQAITTGGSPSTQGFSPFSPSAAYDTSTIGGSGYFDGAGDFLTAPANTAFNLGTGDFTIECWVYLTNSTATTQSIMGIGDTGTTNDIQLWYNNAANKITFNVYGNPRFDSSSTVTTGNWIHLACTRASGTFKLFINGAQEATGSLGNNLSNNVLVIGRPYASLPNNEYFYGYISNLRIVKGTAVYTSAFTPPTTPVTAISGTSVLTNFTNAGIIDNAMMNDLETIGNAQISTTQSKFGSSSMYFDGTGDYLSISNNRILDQIGDYTYECWYYRAGTGTGGMDILCLKNVSDMLYMFVDQTTFKFGINRHNTGTLFNGTTVTATNTWYHVAMCRSGSTVRLFVNGIQEGSTSYSTNVAGSAQTYIAGFPTGYSMNGYIDDLRVTKGYARYTANFTPPTAALPTY